MTATHWQTPAPKETSRLAEARRQAHNALHWMARLANTYREPEENDEHLTLLWHPDSHTLRTKHFGPDLSLELRLGKMELQFCENDTPVPHVLCFEERSPAHVEAWVLVELLHRGMDRDAFTKDLPYEPRDVMLGDHEEHEVEAYAEELALLNSWFCNAAAVLAAVRHDLARDADTDFSQVPIACWPADFQLGLDLPLPAGSGAPSLRAGLSAGDALRPEPYFFVATRQQAQVGDFDPASLLSVKRIEAENLAADNVIDFLRTEVAAHRKRLAS